MIALRMLPAGVLAALVSALLPAIAMESSAEADPVQVIVETTHGSFVLELYPELAPRTVGRFLERVDGASEQGGPIPYAGLRVCESRPHGHLILGCLPPVDPAVGPRGPEAEPQLPDEIDAAGMGLDERILTDPGRVDWLWQQEIYPRYRELKARGEPVPDGLSRLVGELSERGPEATSMLRGKSWRWYLEAIGYRFDPDGSPLTFTRGAVATASYWPREADARFLIALTRIPERDGRATVFGRVVEGWAGIESILAVPLDKSNVPREPIVIRSVRRR
jgi:cyclophilin family peptidyl-prolyl cis-trans isomerase